MRTCLSCFPCFIHQTLHTLQMLKAESHVQDRVLRAVLRHCSEIDLSLPPPAMSKIIHGLIRTECQVPDPYQEVKKHFNLLAMELYPALTQKVRLSPNPLETAVQLAIAGNVIENRRRHKKGGTRKSCTSCCM